MYLESIITSAVAVVAVVLSIGVLFSSPSTEITGPVSYSMYVVGSKTFLLFGDYHIERTGSCHGPAPTIADWLVKVAETEGGVDIFLEIYRGVEIADTGYMQDVVDKLGACVEPGGCSLPNTRVHYVDVRSAPEGPLAKYSDIFQKLSYPETSGKYTGQLPDMREFAQVLKKSHQQTKTSKQLSMIRDRSIAAAIYKFYDDMQIEIIESGSSEAEKFTDLFSLEMDIYALGRMFKTAKDGNTSTRNIVYAGEFHTSNYERFLGSVGRRVCGQGVRSAPDGPVRCVQLDSRVTHAFA